MPFMDGIGWVDTQRDLDWSDVEADGERMRLAQEELRCAICDREMEEYGDDRHGIDSGLGQTTYCGSVLACPEHGSRERQWQWLEEKEYGGV